MLKQVSHWIAECCDTGSVATTSAAELFASFSAWSKRQDLYPGTICSWGTAMKEHRQIVKVKRNGLMAYKGIAIKGRSNQENEKNPAFDAWLRMQFRRNDPVGDLASDVRADPRLKRKRFGYASLLDHLIGSRACLDAIVTLRDAHDEFKQMTKGSKP